MKEKFLDKKWTADSLETLEHIVSILDSYNRQGYRLSVRQTYYQLVARALIPNNERSYKRIVNLISDARLAGIIDWDMIEDRGRETIMPPRWNSPAQIVEAAAGQFAIDRWLDQDYHVEVVVEKAALEGVLIPVCRDEGVNFTANRGYGSQSLLYEMGKRVEQKIADGKVPVILYLGDHDPSGIDMTRDVRERLSLFSYSSIETERLALNWDQIEQWQPPENPAKTTDSRAGAYIAEFGESSWELDAVEPAELDRLVRAAIARLRDDDLYQQAVDREQRMKDELFRFANEYRDRRNNGADDD